MEHATVTPNLEDVVNQVISEHHDRWKIFRQKDTALVGWFVGQGMKKTGGKADPKKLECLFLKSVAEERIRYSENLVEYLSMVLGFDFIGDLDRRQGFSTGHLDFSYIREWQKDIGEMVKRNAERFDLESFETINELYRERKILQDKIKMSSSLEDITHLQTSLFNNTMKLNEKYGKFPSSKE